MIRSGLLTPGDVVRFTPVEEPFNPCSLSGLYLIEYAEATSGTCLGGLWHAMVAAKADYSAALPYRDQPYASGQAVSWNGGYRISSIDTTQTPDHGNDWMDAPKFVGPCADFYADLYCNFVGPYLAHVVLTERLPYLITQITDRGASYGGRSYNAQNGKFVESLTKAVYRDRNKVRAVLDNFLTGQAALPENAACLAGWPGLVTEDTIACGCGNNTCPGGSGCRDSHTRQGYRFSVDGG
jgi:hypothetical protein